MVGSQETCRQGDVISLHTSKRRRRGGWENFMQTNTLSTISLPTKKVEALKAAAVACVIGIGMIFTVGFAPMESVHDAAHDSRHALSFPCH